ncbi:unnamed protein product [Arabidopsis halleri]
MWRRIVSSHLETLAVDVVADSPRRLTALCGGLASEIEIPGSAFSDLNSEWSLGACRGGVWDLDYASLRAIADKLGALLLCDMPHISGLISAQVYRFRISNHGRDHRWSEQHELGRSQQKNRIQVSNTKKPLFFYVNLTM